MVLKVLAVVLALFIAYVVGRAIGIVLGIGPHPAEAAAIAIVLAALAWRARPIGETERR
jgi:hypothetical protein